MPFRKWTVDPVFIGRNPEPPDKVDFCEFEHVTNGVLVKCIQQLGSILQMADRIFEEVGAECRLVYERAERMATRVENCHQASQKLNARAVKVPISDLTASKDLIRNHRQKYRSYQEVPQTQLFLPSNRPPCIDKLYNEACATPVSVICTIDRYRTDGCTSSQLFMVTPVLGGTRRKKNKKMLDIEMRKPAIFTLDKSGQEISKTDGPSNRLLVSPSIVGDMNDRLPSPEERTLAASLEYPSYVVPVNTSGNSFLRMIRSRRSLIHTDFEIKRRKSKHKSKRRHTVCEGSNKELEDAVQKITMINNSCQTEEIPEPTSSLFSFRRSFSRRRRATDSARRETIALDGLNLDFTRKDSDPSILDAKKDSQSSTLGKKSSKGSLISRAAKMNPISSLSAAISLAVKMRHTKPKQDDGRSSSGNWSASSSTRASIDSDQHHAVSLATDRNSNISRCSVGKDSVLSDATTVTTQAQQDSSRNQEQSRRVGSDETKSFCKRKGTKSNPLWDFDRSRDSNASTPERTSDCASTPIVISPYSNRRNHVNYYASTALDDGDSSVYSVDTDGYYTSMHTDSGLWNAINNLRNGDNQNDSIECRRRQESQSSVSTIGNGSINSFLSKIVTETENSSNSGSLKQLKPAPDPPPRRSSVNSAEGESGIETAIELEKAKKAKKFEKENSPPKNGSESDYESRDRIRVKTAIDSSRYPSLCAVSPETSDDETAAVDKPKSQTFIVAEVHREETLEDIGSCAATNNDIPKNTETDLNVPKACPSINMYGGHSPTESIFSSNLLLNGNPPATSTPKAKKSVSSFTADSVENKAQSRESPSLVQKLLFDLKNIPNPSKDLIVSEPPPSARSLINRDNLIPLKYAQRITVTPIVRHESPDCTTNQLQTTPTRSKSFLRNPLINLPFRYTESSSPKPKSPSYISFQSPDSPVSSSTSLTPESSVPTNTIGNRAVARVTLDPMGKVIHSSSSLERNKKDTSGSNVNSPKYSTLPKTSTQLSRQVTSPTRIMEMTTVLSKDSCNNNMITSTSPGRTIQMENCAMQTPGVSSDAHNLFFRPSRGGRFCRTYFPSHMISTTQNSPQDISTATTDSNHRNRYTPSPNGGRYYHKPTVSSNYVRSPTPVVCNPQMYYQPHSRYANARTWNPDNRSGAQINSSVYTVPSAYSFRPVTSPLPSSCNSSSAHSPVKLESLSRKEDMVKDYNLSPLLSAQSYQKLESTDKISQFTKSNPPDVIPSSSTPPSTLDVTARTVRKEGGTLNQGGNPAKQLPNLKSLSSSELFAIIHNSKKRHNIKSDSEKSLSPMSSRSSSPGACMIASPVKTTKIETGVLSRQQKTTETASAVQDRLNRSKPTSMHDFKMLLSQTRVGGNESPSRPSAAELLKVSPTKDSTVSPCNSLPRVSNSSPLKYPQSPVYTVPVKRSTRTRSPYLTRYDSTYPPIWEDCSEEMETADENQNAITNYKHTDTLDNEKPNTHATSTWV